jgi:hypothetical protein
MVKYQFVISRIPIKTSIYGEFPIAMFDYWRVHNQLVFIDSGWRLFWSILGSLSHFGLVDFEILRFAKGLTCNVEVLFSNLFGMISFDRWLFGRIVFGFARCMRVQPMAKMGIWWNSMKHGAIASLFQTHSHYPLVVIYIYILFIYICADSGIQIEAVQRWVSHGRAKMIQNVGFIFQFQFYVLLVIFQTV